MATRLTADEIRDAAHNQVAIAAQAYAEHRLAFARTLRMAADHGLTVPELVEASGRAETLVIALLREID